MAVAGTVNTSQTGVEETGATITGDFGTIGFGPLGESISGFATAVDVTPDEGTVTWVSGNNATQNALQYQVLPADESIGDPDVTYTSPAMGGFSFALGRGDGGTAEQTYYGLKFATDAAGAAVRDGPHHQAPGHRHRVVAAAGADLRGFHRPRVGEPHRRDPGVADLRGVRDV